MFSDIKQYREEPVRALGSLDELEYVAIDKLNGVAIEELRESIQELREPIAKLC